MGGRRNKGCKNNIFIINGIIHDVLKSKKKTPVVLQIYDYDQMFDSIDLEQALSDKYDSGVKDDTLELLYQANKEIHMSVKTLNGLTECQILRNIVLQGDTWGSILASAQVETIGKECIAEGHCYLYNGILPDTISTPLKLFHPPPSENFPKLIWFGILKSKEVIK